MYAQITFWCKSRPFPDQFLQKRAHADKIRKKILDYILKIDISIIFRDFPRLGFFNPFPPLRNERIELGVL